MSNKHMKRGASVSRRTVLKGAGALAGAAAGAGAITGFPAVWSAEEKVLRYLGTAVNQSDDITKKVKADTGITIENIVATTDDVTKRVITQPNSFDVLDTEYLQGHRRPGHGAQESDVPRGRAFDDVFEDSHPVGDADPDRLQRRHARHSPRPHQAPDQQLVGATQSGIQGQGGDPQHSLDRHYGRGDGGRVDRRL
jgi:hypothetical protein